MTAIYIDPPYNTGKEGWAYDDKVNSPMMQNWLGKIVDRDDLERHDKWACMMWPRLQLLHELLSQDGVIFVSCDDNEEATLKLLMNELWGEQNWIGTAVWKSATDNNPTRIAIEHEYIHCFAKNKELSPERWTSKDDNIRSLMLDKFKEISDQFSDLKGRTKAFQLFAKENKDSLGDLYRYRRVDMRGIFVSRRNLENPGKAGYDYEIVHPATGKNCVKPLWGWRFPEVRMRELIEEDRIVFGKDESKIPELKAYLSDVSFPFRSVINLDARKGSNDLEELFGKRDVFKNPKPVELIKYLLEFVANEDALILDSFAGSGTTAQATLALNHDDGGQRRFVLVEAEDYANTLTAERIRKVAQGAPASATLQHGLGGSFTYCELGEPMDMASFFDGATPPAFEQVARYIAYTATGATLDVVADGAEHFVGEAGGYRLHLIYRADAGFMRSDAAMLNMATAERIAAAGAGSGKPILVFAAGKYMGQKQLTAMGLTFAQLPYAIHRMLPGDGDGE